MTRIRTKLARWTIAAALACAALPSHALDPRIVLGGYHHDIWTEAEGAPQSVEALAQTPDGWLWLASAETGLFRFDGVRFAPYVSRDGSTLLRRTITSLRPGPDGSLWIGYAYGGLTVLRDGRYVHLAGRDAIGSTYAIAIGPDGTAWIAGTTGLYRVAGDRVRRVGAEEGFAGRIAQYVLADRHGRVWVAGGGELVMRAPGDRTFHRVREAAEDSLLLEDPEGGVWLVSGKEFVRIAAPDGAPVARPAGRASSYQSLFDAQGSVWSGNCPVGLCRLRPGEGDPERFSALAARERWDQPSQMRSLRVLAMMEDRDGSLWIGTAGGLERLRDQPVHMVPELFDRGMLAAARHPDGSIYALDVSPVSAERHLWRVQGDSVAQLDGDGAQAIANGHDGALLLAGPRGIVRHGRDGVRRIALPDGESGPIRMVAETALGIWTKLGNGGMRRYAGGRWLPEEDDARDLITVAGDAAGRSYLGYRKGRLSVIEGASRRDYGPRDGIALDFVTYILPGRPLLISGDQGTQVLRNGRFEPLSIAALPEAGAVSGIVEGPDGTRWLNTRPGLLRVTPADWAAAMARPGVPLRATLYDMLDGFPGGGAENARRKGTAFDGGDGRLWFTGRRVLAWVDPRRLPTNSFTPPATITGVQADNRTVALAREGAVDLAQGTEDVRIDYTAPSLVIPQRVTFRYRLLGARDEWEDAGTRRSAFYTRLGPGDYTFEVVAINESGVPSAQPTRLAFHIAPGWTQTPWFYGAAAALLAALGTLAYRWRLRRLAARIEERLLVRASERERIARSLHDTFLQSVQGLVLSVHAVMMKLPGNSGIRAELDRVLARADDVLAEGRDEVRGLRSGFATPAEFGDALWREVDAAVPGGLARLALHGIEHVAALRADVSCEVYAIAREALTNGLRHTDGQIALRMHAGAKAFTMEVTDAGTGLGQAEGGRTGHFGLASMRERAAQMGAELLINSTPGGVTVRLIVPAAVAYEGGRRQAAEPAP